MVDHEPAIIHDWRDGLKRIPLHLVTWSLGGAIAVHYWNPAIWIVLAVNGAMEAIDYGQRKDTLAKSLIDFASRVILAVLVKL